MLEGGSIKSKLQKIFKGRQTAWDKFLKPAINATAPFIGMVVSAKTKNPKAGQAITNILRSINGGKILSLTDMHSGAGLRFRVMWNISKSLCIKKLVDMEKFTKCKNEKDFSEFNVRTYTQK